MRLKDRVKNLVSAIKGEIVPACDYVGLKEAHAFQLELQDKRVADLHTEIKQANAKIRSLEEDNLNLGNDNVQLTADNVELLAKNQTLTKHCNDLVNRVETMKKDMNTQIQFMGLINTAVNQITDGIRALPERMESIEKGYLNPLPTEDVPNVNQQ
jgi:DNA repair exonuclease SbcCD ATPase subunit